jgi:hypothetical protein
LEQKAHEIFHTGQPTAGRRLGIKVPKDDDVTILAVEVEDVLTLGETCTPAVTRAISHTIEAMVAEL